MRQLEHVVSQIKSILYIILNSDEFDGTKRTLELAAWHTWLHHEQDINNNVFEHHNANIICLYDDKAARNFFRSQKDSTT